MQEVAAQHPQDGGDPASPSSAPTARDHSAPAVTALEPLSVYASQELSLTPSPSAEAAAVQLAGGIREEVEADGAEPRGGPSKAGASLVSQEQQPGSLDVSSDEDSLPAGSSSPVRSLPAGMLAAQSDPPADIPSQEPQEAAAMPTCASTPSNTPAQYTGPPQRASTPRLAAGRELAEPEGVADGQAEQPHKTQLPATTQLNVANLPAAPGPQQTVLSGLAPPGTARFAGQVPIPQAVHPGIIQLAGPPPMQPLTAAGAPVHAGPPPDVQAIVGKMVKFIQVIPAPGQPTCVEGKLLSHTGCCWAAAWISEDYSNAIYIEA